MKRLAALWLALAGSGCITDRILVEDDKGALYANPAQLERVERETAQRRRLPFLAHVPADVMTVQDLKAWFDRFADARKEELAKEDKFYHRTNILPPTTSTAEAYKGFIGDFVGGVYDDAKARMILISDYAWWSKLQQDAIGAMTGIDWAYEVFLSHELVHALQDQHFDLSDMLRGGVYDDNDDAAFVRKTILETDANVVGMSHFLGMDLEQLATRKSFFLFLRYNNLLSGPLMMALSGRTPSYFAKQSFSQYELGLSFIESKLDQGGMDALSRSYLLPPGTPGALPESSEQLLWPRKMRADTLDPPKPIVRLTAAPDALPGSKLVITNVFGALSFRHWLERLRGPLEANAVADGWGGDRWDMIDDGGHSVLVWRTTWDSEDDAREFVDAYDRGVRVRYGERAVKRTADPKGADGARTTYDVPSSPAEDRFVRTHRDELVVIERRAKDVLIIEGVTPERDLALREEMWPLLRVVEKPPIDEAKLAAKAAALEKNIGDMAPNPERPGLLGRLFLPQRTMALRMGTGIGVDLDTPPGFAPVFPVTDSELRWGFRPGLELSLPLALSGEIMSPVGQTVAGVSLGALFPSPTVGFHLGHAVALGDDLAVVAQLGADEVGNPTFNTRHVAAGALMRPAPFLVLAPGVARVEGGVSGPSVILGSALRRGFAAAPLIEVEVVDGLAIYEASTFFLSASDRGVTLRAHTHALGLLLYF
jgi:hypothetical protein